MNAKLRHLAAALALIMAAGFGGAAWATDYPTGPVTIIVPRAPGGGSDNLARLLGPTLQKKLGVPVVIENHPDASAVLGAQIVSHAKPDGYKVYLSDNSFYQNPAIIKDLPYDPLKDFSAVTMLARGPVILIMNPSIPVKNAKQLVAYAKAHPGKLTYASGGIGSSTHLAGVQFNLANGTNIIHVPFKSSGPALNALLGGHVSMQFGGISSAKPHVEKGSVIALGVTGSQRAASMPNVPTLDEAGVPGVTITSVWGIHTPPGTPLAIRRKLRDAFVASMKDPKVAPRLTELGYIPVGNTPEEHQRQTEKLVTYWLGVAKKIDLTK